jgi:hypothetical protein
MFGWGRRAGRHATRDDAADSGEYDEPAEFVESEVLRGPYDVAEAPSDGIQRLDLASVRFPVPDGSQLQVQVDPAGPVQAVHVVTPIGRLTISAFAAPRSSGLWSEVRAELAEQLRQDGARVLIEQGQWGSEISAESPTTASAPTAALRFVGVDGPRWLLRGVAAGPAEHAQACAKLLYELIDATVVVRGEDPLPVRTPLPIELPEEIARHVQQAQQQTG